MNLGLCAIAERVNRVIHFVSKLVKLLDGGSTLGLSFGVSKGGVISPTRIHKPVHHPLVVPTNGD